MNRDTTQGKFTQLKGKIKEQWGKLTDDEIDELEGKSEILAGKLQERYGRNRDEIMREVDMFLNQYDRPTTGQQPTGTHQGQQPRNVGHEPEAKPGDRKRKVS